MGSNIPFRSLGHSSLQEFLLSVPEIFARGTNAEGAPLLDVKDEKLQHIQELVSHQKGPKKKPASKVSIAMV